MKNYTRALTAFVILVLGLGNWVNTGDFWINLFVFVYCAAVVLVPQKFATHFKKNWIIVLPLLIAFVISAFVNSTSLRNYLSREPVDETYRTDMDDFLKTYYLMKKGNSYYLSFKQAVEANAFKSTVSANAWSWRTPTIFYIWKIIPGTNGVYIYYFFLGFVCITLLCAYKLIHSLLPQNRGHYAILAPYLLYPYFHFATRDNTFLQTEWWGIQIAVWALYFLIKDRMGWAALLWTLTLTIRELFIIPFLLQITVLFIKRQPHRRILLIPLIIFGIFLLWHFQMVIQIVSATSGFFTPRLHTLGKMIILPTLAFGSWEYLFSQWRVFIIFYIISAVGLFQVRSYSSWLIGCFLLFPVSFLFIGSSVYNDYWGIFYIPVVLISVPLVLHHL